MIPKQRKIVILGYRSVGKSSLSIQFVYSDFIQSYNPTIENTFVKITTINNEEYELNLLDTAGQDEYSILPMLYFMDVHGYILVYSITSRKSFEVIKTIYDKILNLNGNIKLPIILVGNKKDLYMERVVTEVEGRNLANLWKVEFFEVSAKQNECVSGLIHNMVMEIAKANNKTQTNQNNCNIL